MFRPKRRLTGNDGHFSLAFPVAANQTITEGDVVTISSGLVAIANASTTSILGVAAHDITTGSTVTSADTLEVFLPNDIVYEADFEGTIKDELADSDRFSCFQVNATGDKINLDDTGNQFMVIGYNNTRGVAYVVNQLPVIGAVSATISGLTATVAELNILDGATVTTEELNKLGGAGAVVASGTTAASIADLGDTPSDGEIATAVNAIIDALQAFKIVATD